MDKLKLFKKLWKEITGLIIFIFIFPLILQEIQKTMFTSGSNLDFWEGCYSGFLLMNLAIGWVPLLYLLMLIKKNKITTLLKFLFPLSTLIYISGVIFFFGHYSIISDETLITRNGLIFPVRELLKLNAVVDVSFTQSPMAEGGYYFNPFAILENGTKVDLPSHGVYTYLMYYLDK